MIVNIESSLRYPFRSDNWKQAVLWPGIGVFVFMLIIVGFYMMIALLNAAMGVSNPSMDPDSLSPVAAIPAIIGMLLILGLEIVLFTILGGYLFNAVHLWIESGIEATAPYWKGNWGRYLVDGLKLFTVFLVIGLLYIIPMVPFGILMSVLGQNPIGGILFILFMIILFVVQIGLAPFMYGIIFNGAKDRRLGSLFDLKSAFQLTAPRYGQIFLAILINMGISLVVMIPIILLHLVTCGVGSIFVQPFIFMPLMLIQWHLVCQAFLPDTLKQLPSSPPEV